MNITPPLLEMDLITKILEKNPKRHVSKLADCRWGHLFVPAPEELACEVRGLRLLLIGSWTPGLLVLLAMRKMQETYPDKLGLVGLVTDDPLDSKAKITAQKRFWHYYAPLHQEKYVQDVIDLALGAGLPCFTGEVKSQAFKKLLAEWNPDAIVVVGFGQLIDKTILDMPRFGVYNVHPSDLLSKHGMGPQPWEDLITRQEAHTRVSVHIMSEEIDAGAVLGASPLINVGLKDGTVPSDVLMIAEKTILPMQNMVCELIRQLIKLGETEASGPLGRIDFESCFSAKERAELSAPLDPDKRGLLLPLPAILAGDEV